MSIHALPKDGWAESTSSYRVAIVRPLVAAIRNEGPLGAAQARAMIISLGQGADVAKASPKFDYEDGAQRILNFFVSDVTEVSQASDGSLTIDPQATEAHSVGLNFTVPIDDAATVAAVRERMVRHTHLRRWIATQPFTNVWKHGIVMHSEEDVVAMADLITEFGYHSDMKITYDQNGVCINGNLRVAALAKLGIDPEPFIETRVFNNDAERLAWYLAAHCHGGKWPTEIKKAVTKVIDRAAVRSGVTLGWPHDLTIAVGRFDESQFIPPKPEPVVKHKPVKPPEPPVVGIASLAPADLEALVEEGITTLKKLGPPKRLAGRQTEIQKGLMLLLENGGVVPRSELKFMAGSERHMRSARYGWTSKVPGNYIMLTEEGARIAAEVWKSERPHRHVPAYEPQKAYAAQQRHDRPVLTLVEPPGEVRRDPEEDR